MPPLNAYHLAPTLGDQGGIQGGKVSPLHLEGLTQLCQEKLHQSLCHGSYIPEVFGKETLPTAEVAVYKKAGLSYICDALMPSCQQKTPDVALEIDKVRLGEASLKEARISQKDRWKNCGYRDTSWKRGLWGNNSLISGLRYLMMTTLSTPNL